MTAIYLMLPVSLLLAFIFLLAYVWSVRSGQYEDTHTPAMRILTDEAGGATAKPVSGANSSLNHP
jgi:cbb3-type cytochrome oxidase maturation protein